MPKLVIKDSIDKVEIYPDERCMKTEEHTFEFWDKKGLINQDLIGKKVTITVEW